MMTAYATKTQPQYTAATSPAVALGNEDAIYEVFRPLGALEQRIAYARGAPEDIHTFYAAQVPGEVKLREIRIQDITPRMAQRAVASSVERILAASTLEGILPN